jgi:SRSO17 transposase
MGDATAAADVARWAEEIDRVRARLGPRFARSEVRHRVGLYLRGLLAGVERKNGWQLAEFAGDLSPANVQHFIGRAAWDADAVRDDLRAYVVEHLGDPDGVLIVDETGFLKKGDKSVGVQRQYTGTAGRVENSQVGVFLAYKGARGHALIDRALYLPKCWAGDAHRREVAHVPGSVTFATKPALARAMVERALEAGVPAAWVTADEVYGSDSKFRRTLEGRGVGYVLAVACSQRLFLGGQHGRADDHADDLPAAAWVSRSCGAGSKGDRLYEWAFVPFSHPTERGLRRGLLVRRSLADPAERAYYLTHAPVGASEGDLARAAGSRWAVEECFELAKGECGLAHGEGRTWHAWHRHVTLSMFALAILTALRSRAGAAEGGGPAPAEKKLGRG